MVACSYRSDATAIWNLNYLFTRNGRGPVCLYFVLKRLVKG